MQVFVIGKTKSGKSSLAKVLESLGFTNYEAGAWARKEFSEVNTGDSDELSPVFKENLTCFAMNKLKENPYYSFEKFIEFKKNFQGDKLIISGVRNPDDFIRMLACDSDTRVFVIESSKEHGGSLQRFEEGVEVILSYLQWRKNTKEIPVMKISEVSVFSDLVQDFQNFLK